jgi:ABC-type multidrug transport system fused ATPase/permease subunit
MKTEKEIKALAAISISIFAALLAINTLIAGSNSGKVLTNTIEANNVWAWYQAKNIRGVIYETAGKKDDAHRMEADKKELAEKAKALEAERNVAKARSPWFTYAGSLLQIGIVLSTAAILAIAMPLYWASIAVGSLGALSFVNGYFMLWGF